MVGSSGQQFVNTANLNELAVRNLHFDSKSGGAIMEFFL